MKIILILIIMICFVYIGYSLSESYKKKIMYYSDLSSFLSYLKTNIIYNSPTIYTMIINYKFESIKLKKELNNYLSDGLITDNINSESLLKDFLEQFGKKDKTETIRLIDLFYSRCKTMLDKLQQNSAKNTVLPLKLSFYCGLVICIILL